MKKNKLALSLSLVGVTLITAGCIPEEDDSSFSLSSFEVTTTSKNDAGTSVIDPNENNGEFTLNWKASFGNTPSRLYFATVSVSSDSVLDDSDAELFGQNCGTISGLYNCGETGSISCTFDTDNVVSCPQLTNSDTNLNSYISENGLPNYIILEACAYDATMNLNCFEKSQEVEFR